MLDAVLGFVLECVLGVVPNDMMGFVQDGVLGFVLGPASIPDVLDSPLDS